MTHAHAIEIDPEVAWQAVLDRDRSRDGDFVYAVRSTGIYCRPSCPSRRPRRDRVAFFPGAASAEREGFRACRRCRPASAGGAPADQRVRRTVELLEASLERADPEEVPTLGGLAAAVGASPAHLLRSFRERLGLTPKEYLDARRLERLKEELQAGGTVADATYGAGFGSSRGVYEKAVAALGMTPGAYRRGGPGLRVRFTIVPSDLGRLLVAATDRGIAAVALGGDDEELAEALRRELPRAELVRDDAGIRPWVEAVLARLSGARPGPAVPLELRGTAFQLRVWKELQTIPLGETRSYSEVAAALGRPTAARAVARAVATNPVAVVVPCHRVVRRDGSLAGYRWGTERKRALLERERRVAAEGEPAEEARSGG